MGEIVFNDYRVISLGGFNPHSGGASGDIQVHRAGTARCRFTERLTDVIGKLICGIDGDIVFCNRCEEGAVFYLLVGVAMLPQRGFFPGNRDDRR
jgi:hypothetical protein